MKDMNMLAVLERWKLSHRFAIFGVLGIALLAAPLTMYVRMSQELIGAARLEQEGVEPVKKVIKVIQFTQQHRGMSASVLGGNADMEQRRSVKQAEVDTAVEAFAAVVKSRNDAKLSQAWEAAERNWKALSQAVAGKSIDGKDSNARHTALIADQLVLVELVADHFGLTLDPEADGYYLMAAVVRHLPQLTESLGQSRARGTLHLSQKNISTEDRATLFGLVNQIATVQATTSRALAKAVERNDVLKARLGTVSQESAEQTSKAVKLIRGEILGAEKLTFAGADYYQTITQVIDAQFKLTAQGVEALNEVLNVRIAKLRKTQFAVLGVIALVVALAIWLGLLVTRSIMRQLGGEPVLAARVASRVAQGDLSHEIAVEPGDSTSILAAMSRMQEAIKKLVAAQAEMKARHDDGLISHRIDAGQFSGSYAEMATNTNELVAAHMAVEMRLVEVVKRYAAGDLSVDMDRLPGEKAKVTEAIDGVKASLEAVNAQIQTLVEAAGRGDFTVRGDETRFDHDFRRMVAGLNRLMQTSDTGLNEVSRVLGALARGDLTEKMSGEYQGAFGKLKDDSNKTVENLTDIVNQLKEASEAIDTASKEISHGNADLSSRTEEQASSLEETASSMEELTSTVKQNAENARQANQLAVGASDVAVQGGDVVKQVVDTMRGISESSRKIADIIGTIDGIAFQTNILALNAAVEAARAGEQGRGFAVVASEVRNLAQRSANAAKEIKSLIEDSVNRVDAGSRLVEQAGQTMDEIVTSVKRVTDIMAEITAASQEQSSGIEQVNQAITQMDEVTQQNAALVEQAAAAAESMQEQAGGLVQAVATFKLDQGNALQAERRGPNRAVNVARLPARPAAKSVKAVARTDIKPAPKKAVGADEDWQEF
jgi:methyl-accepting chemotaxis protein